MISCAGLGDWEYELPNGYSIIRLNASTIIIGSDYKGYESSIIFERYITSFAYNEQYVCARRLDVPENYFFDDIMNMDFEEAEYLIIDTISHEIHSSLSKEEYQSLCKELNITGLCDWIDTYPDPEGAIY
ncbi:MAG: DUF3997 domain-containing protein [Clostridia bacterium]|nr:DUF3997 domain-containing protein [Clostridia bacterium]